MSAPGQSVSVVIPTHNRAPFVGEAISSVLAQRERPREVIVVDDCSEDETPELLKRFGDSIRVIRTEANVERGAARNLGAALATGEALAFLDSDDVWDTGKLRRQLAAVPPSAPSITGVRLIGTAGRDTGRRRIPARRSDREILIDNYCFASPSTMVVPKLAFEEVGGFPVQRRYQGSEDWMFLVKLLWAGWPVKVVREALAGYRLHPGGWTQQPENLERSMWAACQWLEEQRLSPPRFVAARRNWVATAIACAYLVRAEWSPARHWSGIAVTHGGPADRLRSCRRLAKSTARGVTGLWRPAPA
ncbi:MAG TPA: glycosyltransferase family A protein [Solirubrobacterales bacterium]|jgi:teichuronic acid biosynthesis glycosyltransferase TuaG|nr:glycosyltransferase family A protein [Solirubrobacterales bacterium]